MPGKKKQLDSLDQDLTIYGDWADPGADEANESADRDYSAYLFRKVLFILVLIAGAILIIGVSITAGDYPIGILESYQILLDHIIRGIQSFLGMDVPELDYYEDLKDHVVWNLRLPRIAIGIVAGIGLAVAGTAMQSTLRNPLADPYTTGISSGACFGATLAICFGSGVLSGSGPVVISAFIFSLIPTAMIISISMVKKVSPVSMILAGIAVMYIFNSFTTVMRLWADPNDLEAVFQWQVGSFNQVHWEDLPVMLLVTAVGSAVIVILSRDLNILSSGDENARSLGLNANHMRIAILVIVSLMAASIVSFTGIIGFVGLVAPHVCRMFIGADNRYLVPASAAFGAFMLIGSDLLGRVIIAPAVLDVGVVTSFLGGPLFLYLIIKQKKEVWG